MRLHKKMAIGMFMGLLALGQAEIAMAADSVDITLNEGIQFALKNNRTLKEYIDELDRSDWALKEVQRTGGATISWTATAEKIGGKAYSSTEYDREFANTLEVSVPVYTSGKLDKETESALYGIYVAQLNLENQKQTLRQTVADDYYNILQYRSQIKVYQDAVNDLQAHLESVNAQYAAGTVAKSDVLSSEVLLANEQQYLTSAQNNYRVAVATFNKAVGLPVGTMTNLKDEMVYTPHDISLENCLTYAMEHRPDALAGRYQVLADQAEIETTKAAIRPQISAVGVYKSAGSQAFGDDHTSSDYWGVGLSASWSIFDNNITETQVKQGEATLRKAEEAAKEQEDTIQLDVQTAYLNLITAEKNIKTLTESVDKAKDDYRIEMVRYNAGVGTNLDVLDAEKNLREAEGNYVTAVYTYNTSKAALDKAMGISVDLDVPQYKAKIGFVAK